MLCPFCQTLLIADAQECPACRITFPRTSALVGALPRLSPVLADTTGQIDPHDQAKLKKRIAAIQRRFPQLVLQVVMHVFPTEHPFSMHVFWLFNAGNFAGDSKRGKENHALLIALDPNRSEAAIMPGYGLETFLKPEALDHLLELAGPAWQNSRWTDGIMRVLDGLDQLLESIAIPIEPALGRLGEY
jgi:uncharacterized membrane protein YgcG